MNGPETLGSPEHTGESEDAGLEQRARLELLRSTLQRLLARHWPEPARAGGGTPAQRRDTWQALAGIGLAALGGASDAGGWQELLLAMSELGYAACPVPLAAAALANDLLGGAAAAGPLLAGLHDGTHCFAFALGGWDGEPDAGEACLEGAMLRGTLRYVEGMDEASHLLVLARTATGCAAAVLPAAGLRSAALPGLAVPPLNEVQVAAAPALSSDATTRAADLQLSARLLLLARAHGAARRMFELAVEHAKLREQFGQAIGGFQAIQHKLAGAFIALEGCRAMLRDVAQARDAAHPQWRIGALAALAACGASLRQVAMDAHQVLGAAGYDESHELPRHFRRVHADLARHGGVRAAERALAARLLEHGDALPETRLDPAGEQFRHEVRAWLAQHWGAKRKAAHDALPYGERVRHPAFEAALGRQGWLGIAWPREHGGQQRSLLEQLAYIQELERVDAPGLRMSLQAPALIRFGTPAQQQFYLPRLLRGEIRICLGYSEAGAGSDLSALRTSAVADGDGWIIDGEKLWSTHADFADYVWLAARTDPQAQPPHAGISMFIVPLKNQPGVSVRPGMAMYGRKFCSIRFDRARVPRDALVGPLHGGWKMLTAALAEERLQMGSVVFRCRRVFEALVAHVAARPALANDAGIRERLGALAAKVETARALLADSITGRELPPHAAAMAKVYSSDLMQELGEAGLTLLGMPATLSQGAPGCILNGELEQLLRHSLMYTIGGGTQEIQKTLIAVRGLGLGGGRRGARTRA